MRKIIAILVLAVMLCPVFGATFQSKGNQSIEFELDNEMAEIIISDIEAERATIKCFAEETMMIWYTDSEGKLTNCIILTPQEFNYLKAYCELYILKYMK